MRTILLILIFCIFFTTNNALAMSSSEYVIALEKKLFGITYETETLDKRIDRIETQIYDNNYSGTNEERLEKIYKIYPKSEFLNNNANTSNTSQTESDKYDYYATEESPDTNYNNYPIVNEIEESIYKKNFSGEDIYKRLERIEQNLYGYTKTNQSLQDRVAALRPLIPKQNNNRYSNPHTDFNKFEMNNPYNYQAYSQQNYNSYKNSPTIINELELETFNKSFDNDLLSQRIERLERFYFGKPDRTQTNEYRLNRLAAIIMNNQTNNLMPKGSQWASILLNILMMGLGFLL